jgi:uncharacterized membrane protein
MLQIIGWILCLYLAVKACELLSMQTDRHPYARYTATFGAFLALLGAVIFFLMINAQVKASKTPKSK